MTKPQYFSSLLLLYLLVHPYFSVSFHVGVPARKSRLVSVIDPPLTHIPSSACPPQLLGPALLVSDATDRWSQHFVRRFNLCPWAGGSIDIDSAVRHHILFLRNLDRREMEGAVRSAGAELMRCLDAGEVSERYGIAFVTFLKKADDETKNKDARMLSNQSGSAFEYGDFYEIFLELEDAFLDEAEDGWETGVSRIGSRTTIAAFHPKWVFAESNAEDSINYEKRSPFPTISIVSSAAIDRLMDHEIHGTYGESATATVAVGEHNERILKEVGSEELKKCAEYLVMDNGVNLEEC
mmetsp:Transcript_1084/g.2364  ORF Transcript_1084/g.2364 Transcript_1084/m.2364 type:complete len:295 (+) Transcript_1084:34-918(+)